ncbi:uncharacterized protein A4U43_C03F12790 [Asparagus officinalis]|uniref:Uncharacterized protein n=1 Tax=Asparagus officinalis TaxID=4686 RepID=A0A5P1FDS8_ASPOF|nr:uncharacterized protein A4U43_C03F12790 [Asparagus officinalis]
MQRAGDTGEDDRCLKTSNSKKLAEISQLWEDLDHLQHELHEQEDRIRYLSEEVEVKRQDRNDAYNEPNGIVRTSGNDGGEESAEEAGEGSADDSWVSQLGEKKG